MRRSLPLGRAEGAITTCHPSTSFRNGSKGFVALNQAQGCGPAQHLCDALQNGIADVVNSPFFPSRIWLWLPDVPPQFWYLALLSPVGLCAAFFLLFTFFLDHERRNLSAALKEALAKARVDRFNQQTNSQSVGSMKAGRDIKIEKIEQTINNSPELRNWDSSFVKSPVGQIIIAAVGGFLSFLLGKLFSS
jgi:hypothetical protein